MIHKEFQKSGDIFVTVVFAKVDYYVFIPQNVPLIQNTSANF